MKYKRGPSHFFLQGKLPCLTLFGLTVVGEHREVANLGKRGTITSAQIGPLHHRYQEKKIKSRSKKFPKCSIQHLKQSHWKVVLLLLLPNQPRSGVWTTTITITILSHPRPVPADVWRALGMTSARVQSPTAVPQSQPQRLNSMLWKYQHVNKLWCLYFEPTLHMTS